MFFHNSVCLRCHSDLGFDPVERTMVIPDETFVRCLLSDLEGAHVFNLEGSVIDMQELVSTLDRLRPGAARLISVGGPKVPVAYRMDDSQLRAKVPGIPKTPLEEGIGKTLEHFDRLSAAAGA